MIVTCVTIYVKEPFIPNFIEATLDNHRNSIKEEGNLRFDLEAKRHGQGGGRSEEDEAAS